MHRRRKTTNRTDRRDVKNGTDPFTDHLFVERLCNGEQAVDICVDNPVPALVGGRRKIVALIYRRVIYKHVDRAPSVEDLAGDVLHSKTVGNRNLERKGLAAMSFDFLLNFFGQGVARMVVESDVGAFACKDLAYRGTDTARSA